MLTPSKSTPNNGLIIAGGGIAGLAAALSLARHGHHPAIVEQNISPSGKNGYAIQLGANAVRVLQALGIHDALAPLARNAGHAVLFSRDNRTLAKIPLPQPHWHLHRAALINALKAACDARGIEILPGQFSGLRQNDHDASLILKDGREIPASRIVAADGVHSPLRMALGLSAPPPAKTAAWRNMIPDSPGLLPHAEAAYVWCGRGRHAVAYRIAGPDKTAAINLVCVTPAADTLSDCLTAFSRWNTPLRTLIAAADSNAWHDSPVLHMPPVFQKQGRVILIGDAAHPLPPHLAQGAGMALEDALMLAECMLPDSPDTDRRLARYARERRRRVRHVRHGAIVAGRLFQHAGGHGIAALLGRVWGWREKRRFAPRQGPRRENNG